MDSLAGAHIAFSGSSTGSADTVARTVRTLSFTLIHVGIKTGAAASNTFSVP